jgi:hypothetical protein
LGVSASVGGRIQAGGHLPTRSPSQQVAEEVSSNFTSDFRAPPQAGTRSCLTPGGATCYRAPTNAGAGAEHPGTCSGGEMIGAEKAAGGEPLDTTIAWANVVTFLTHGSSFLLCRAPDGCRRAGATSLCRCSPMKRGGRAYQRLRETTHFANRFEPADLNRVSSPALPLQNLSSKVRGQDRIFRCSYSIRLRSPWLSARSRHWVIFALASRSSVKDWSRKGVPGSK